MDTIIWGGGPVLLGLFLGYFYPKRSFLILTLGVAALLFFIDGIVRITGGDIMAAGKVRSFAPIPELEPFMPIVSAYDKLAYLPSHVQNAFFAFIVTFFLSRVAKWMLYGFGSKDVKETDRQRRVRVLKSFGMKSMNDVQKID